MTAAGRGIAAAIARELAAEGDAPAHEEHIAGLERIAGIGVPR